MIKIMFVDDEDNITDSCVILLKALGYDAYGAKNSEEAFEIIEKISPDIAFLDVNLRGKYTGIDVLEKALSLHPKMQIAIITGRRDEDLLNKCLEKGAKLVVIKPITCTKLKELIENFVKKIA